jgi:dipeptidase
MASENVYSLGEELGWLDPKKGETFKLWKAYNGRRSFSTREYYVLSILVPSLNLEMTAKELPFSVEPDKKVSIRDVMKFYRETYAWTEMDMIQNLMVRKRRNKEMEKSPVVSPWMSNDLTNLLNILKPGTVKRYRTIAISACYYSQITQCRDWLPDPVGGICWFAFDNPGQSARIPIFAGVTELLPSFEICD